MFVIYVFFFFFSSRRRHTRLQGDWSSDVCSSDLSKGWRAERTAFRFTGRTRRSPPDRKSTRLNSSHLVISYAVFCLKKKEAHISMQTTLGVRQRRLPISPVKNFFPASSVLSSPTFFFFNDTATTEIYTLSLHDALPIYKPLAHLQQASSGPESGPEL